MRFYNWTRIILVIISGVTFAACGVNDREQTSSSGVGGDFVAEMINESAVRSRVLESEDSTHRPTAKEITFPVCVMERYEGKPIVGQRFLIEMDGQKMERTSDSKGCLHVRYELKMTIRSSPEPIRTQVTVTGLDQFRGRQVFAVQLNPENDRQILLDLRVHSEEAPDAKNTSRAQLLLLDGMSINFQDQDFSLKRSLELKLKRKYSFKFRPMLLEYIQRHENPVIRPLTQGDLKIRVYLLSNLLNLSNIRQNLSACNTNCLIASNEETISFKNRFYVEGIVDLEVFYHDFSSMAEKNVLIVSIDSTSGLFAGQYYVTQVDSLKNLEQFSEPNILDLTPAQVSHLEALALRKKTLLASDLPIAESELILQNGLKAEKDERLRTLLPFTGTKVSAEHKQTVCDSFFSSWFRQFQCKRNFADYFVVRTLDVYYGDSTQKIVPEQPDQFVLKTSVDHMFERRTDVGVSSGDRYEYGTFAETSLLASGGMKILGNGVVAKAETGFKSDQRIYKMTFDTHGTSERVRSQSNVYKEYLVDQTSFTFQRVTQKCIVLEQKSVAHVSQEKNFYLCLSPERPQRARDSIYFVRLRYINEKQAGLVDLSKSGSSLRKTLFGEKEFARFKSIFEKQLVRFVETESLDVGQELTDPDQFSRQMPIFVDQVIPAN